MRQGMLLAMLALSAGGAGAQATDRLVASYCQPGQGCESCITGYTVDEAISLGVVREFHRGGVLVVAQGADGEWKSQSAVNVTPASLHAAFGGGGAPKPVHASCAARPSLPGTFQPRNGEWEITVESRSLPGCSAAVRELASGEKGSLRDTLDFPAPFRGEIPHLMPRMIQTGPNAFEGIVQMGDVQGWIYMVVRSEDEVLVSTSLVEGGEISLDCEASVIQTFRRVVD